MLFTRDGVKMHAFIPILVTLSRLPLCYDFSLRLSSVVVQNNSKNVEFPTWLDSILYNLTHEEPQTVEKTLDSLTNRLLFEVQYYLEIFYLEIFLVSL